MTELFLDIESAPNMEKEEFFAAKREIESGSLTKQDIGIRQIKSTYVMATNSSLPFFRTLNPYVWYHRVF